MSENNPTFPADRIVEARERAGVETAEIAKALGISVPHAWDLESYDNEVTTTLSLSQVCVLARLLGCSPRALVAPDGVKLPESDISIASIFKALRSLICARGVAIEVLENEIGWEFSNLLEEPERAWMAWNVDCLHNVCAAVGLDWLAVLPTE